jgi:hypothetical protein
MGFIFLHLSTAPLIIFVLQLDAHRLQQARNLVSVDPGALGCSGWALVNSQNSTSIS